MSRILFLAVVPAALLLGVAGWSAAPPGEKAEGAPPPAARPAPPARHPVHVLLQRVNFPGLDDPKLTLTDVLEKLEKDYGLTCQINERAFRHEMLNDVAKSEVVQPNAIPPMKTTLARVLQRVLDRIPSPSRATYMVREDHVEITTGQFQAAEVATEREQTPPRPQPAVAGPVMPGAAHDGIGGIVGGLGGGVVLPPSDEEVKKIQVAVVSVALERQPLEEAVRQIRAQAHVNLVLDPSAGEKARTPLTVTLLNAPVDSAARVLTELADLDFVWLDNTFFVTSRDRAEKLRARWPARRAGGTTPLFIPGAAAGGM